MVTYFLRFFPAGGHRQVAGNIASRGTSGYYWTSSVSTVSHGYYLGIYSASAYILDFGRTIGLSVRCVAQ